MTRSATNAFKTQKIRKDSTSFNCSTMVKNKLKKPSRNRVNGANISEVAIN